MKKVIFVCTGNTCRSPMAEIIANKLWNGRAEALSCGFGPSGLPISAGSLKALEKIGIEAGEHYSVAAKAEELLGCDLILTMSGSHKREILRALPQLTDRVYTLCEYVGETGDIPDPYMMGQDEYDKCCGKIYECIKKIDTDKL